MANWKESWGRSAGMKRKRRARSAVKSKAYKNNILNTFFEHLSYKKQFRNRSANFDPGADRSPPQGREKTESFVPRAQVQRQLQDAAADGRLEQALQTTQEDCWFAADSINDNLSNMRYYSEIQYIVFYNSI